MLLQVICQEKARFGDKNRTSFLRYLSIICKFVRIVNPLVQKNYEISTLYSRKSCYCYTLLDHAVGKNQEPLPCPPLREMTCNAPMT
jgi:hypothetical protein